jgi:putative transposase
MDERHRDVALFRYSLIREAADVALTTAERGRLVRAVAAREHTGPHGERVRVGRSTLDRWIRDWRAGGSTLLCRRPGPSRRQHRRRCWTWR